MKRYCCFLLVFILLFVSACSSTDSSNSASEEDYQEAIQTIRSLQGKLSGAEDQISTLKIQLEEALTSQSSAPAQPTVYPRTVKEEYIKKATSAPTILYDENSDNTVYEDSIFWFIGTVSDISSFDSDDGQEVDYFLLETEEGTVMVIDFYSSFLQSHPDDASFIEESYADYSFPSVGEYVKIYSMYQYSSMQKPVVAYGVPRILVTLSEFSSSSENSSDSSSSHESPAETSPASTEEPNFEVTFGMKNALACAIDYLEVSAFSYSGLIDQLEYEGYTLEEAMYAVDNCGADWFEQAAKCAASYLSFTSFSRSGLISQLEYEGFTHEQAVYGAEQNGY